MEESLGLPPTRAQGEGFLCQLPRARSIEAHLWFRGPGQGARFGESKMSPGILRVLFQRPFQKLLRLIENGIGIPSTRTLSFRAVLNLGGDYRSTS